MQSDEKDKAMVGVAALLLCVACVVAMVATAVAVGCAFGAPYGFLALAAWAVAVAVALARVIRKMAAEGRDDG